MGLNIGSPYRAFITNKWINILNILSCFFLFFALALALAYFLEFIGCNE
jgi:hypothetical protein